MSLQEQNTENLPTLSCTNLIVIQSEWHKSHSDIMFNYFTNFINKMGENNTINRYYVPGCWEIPQFLSFLLQENKDKKNEKIDAVILFGILLKGDTFHFDMILNTLSQSLSKIILKSKVPVINEILPVTTIQQVEERSGDNQKNKGIEAAIAAAKMINLIRQTKNKS